MSGEPTLGEVMRQVRDLIGQVRDLVKEVRSDYVRKDLYEARHGSLSRRVDELETEASDREKARVAFQRQVVAGVLVGLVLMIVQLVVTALMFTGGLT